MASIEIDLGDLPSRLQAVRTALDRGAARGLAVLADRAAAYLRANVPVRTGQTRNSVRGVYDPNTRRGLVIVAHPALLWYRRNITPNYPNTRPQALAAWVKANGLRIIAAEIRRELATLSGG